MTGRTLRILQVSTYDTVGGAAKVAWGLFQAYRARGHDSWLAVGHQLRNDPNVLRIPSHERRSRWSRFWWDMRTNLQSVGARVGGVTWLAGLAHVLAEPGKALDHYRGIEDFRFPGTWQLLGLAGRRPDLIHCHNLHGGYFDLRALPWLSQQVPLVLTLHDAWLLSGHCAHSLNCERWKMGCGQCPDLALDPAIRRDATAYNWRRKREIYRNSRLYVATPARWLMQKVEQSTLAAAVAEARVIPNGVDLSIFHPADKGAARETLGVRRDIIIILFTAHAIRRNIWKDYQTVRDAITLTVEQLCGQELLFIALGEDAPVERIGPAEVRFVSYQEGQEAVARYYQAADVYVHATHADTFPNTVLEAMACGTPVVATAVGGIPEQVDDGQTGFLVPGGDAQAMAARLMDVLLNDTLREQMGAQAAEVARQRFDLRQQVDQYLAWYHELAQRTEPAPTGERV